MFIRFWNCGVPKSRICITWDVTVVGKNSVHGLHYMVDRVVASHCCTKKVGRGRNFLALMPETGVKVSCN
jgi:hypothetical protein